MQLLLVLGVQSCLDPVINAPCSTNRMVNEARYFYWEGTGLVTMVPSESLYDLAPDSLDSSQIGLRSLYWHKAPAGS